MTRTLCYVAIASAILAAFASWATDEPPSAGAATFTATALATFGGMIGVASLRRLAPGGAALRWLLYAMALAVIGQVLFGGSFSLGRFLLRFGVTVGLAAMALPLRKRFVERPVPLALRIADLLLGSLLILLFGFEVGARIFAHVAPNPLFDRPAAGAEQRLAMHATPEGLLRWGFPVLAGGHYDQPFLRRENQRVTLLIDSDQSIGMVPHSRHFSTVAEQQFEDRAIWNMGVADTGPIESRQLLETTGIPLAPDAVVLGLDLSEAFARSESYGQDSELRALLSSWLDPDNVLLLVIPRHLGERLELRRQLGDRDPRLEALAQTTELTEPAQIDAAFPWLEDPSLQRPSLPRELWISRARRKATTNAGIDDRAPLFALLDACRQDCITAGLPFALMLIPAEYQVDDGLWREIGGGISDLQRQRPQALLHDYCKRRQIPCLDLLPFLRAAPQRDGQRPDIFHLRDGRLSARGNRAVGIALADFLRRLPSK